jgi:hypothetical protein
MVGGLFAKMEEAARVIACTEFESGVDPTPPAAPPEQDICSLDMIHDDILNSMNDMAYRLEHDEAFEAAFRKAFEETTQRSFTDQQWKEALDLLRTAQSLPTDPDPHPIDGPARAKTYPTDGHIEIYEDVWVEDPPIERRKTLIDEFNHALIYVALRDLELSEDAQHYTVWRMAEHLNMAAECSPALPASGPTQTLD